MGEALGLKLVEQGHITQAQLGSAQQMQKSIGGPLAPILQKLGYISEAKLLEVIAELEGLKSVALKDVTLSGELMISLSRELMEKNGVLPIKRTDTTLTLAVADLTNLAAIEEVRFTTGLSVETVLMSRREIQRALNEFFYQEDSGRLPRQRDRQDVRELARTIEDEGLHEKQPTHQASSLAADRRARADAIDGLGVPPAKVMKALAGLMVEKGLITLDELKEEIARLD